MVDVLATVRPRDESSVAANESLNRIDSELSRIESETAALRLERVDMLVSGASATDLRKVEKALDDLALDEERLKAIEAPMRERYAAAVRREAAEAKASKCEIAAAAVLKFNEALDSEYVAAAQRIIALIELERQAYAALREAAAGGSLPATLPVPTRVWIGGGNPRWLGASVQLPSIEPGRALAWHE